MARTEPIIAVNDIPTSTKFYQDLLDCTPTHGGSSFEILTDDSVVLLCLHRWTEHEHPTMKNPSNPGNGLILLFRVDDLYETYERAEKMKAKIEEGIHYNNNSLKNQFTLWDLDGYYLIISE
ncbi:MAG TPA: VOC family protein [Sphingobacterium sp.]|nr:VOC family protein [Sphingobacterium sp.]